MARLGLRLEVKEQMYFHTTKPAITAMKYEMRAFPNTVVLIGTGGPGRLQLRLAPVAVFRKIWIF